MKNVFKATLFFAMVILMSACGGSADAADLVGEWVPDLAKVELNLSDEIPAEMRAEVEKGMADKEQMAKAQTEMEKELKIEFKEDGKLIVGAEGESQEMDWKIDGSNLVISSEVPGAPAKAEIAFEIVESSADLLTVKLAGSSLLEQVEKQLNGVMTIDQLMQMAEGQTMGMLSGFDLKTAIEESSMQFSFNKKS